MTLFHEIIIGFLFDEYREIYLKNIFWYLKKI